MAEVVQKYDRIPERIPQLLDHLVESVTIDKSYVETVVNTFTDVKIIWVYTPRAKQLILCYQLNESYECYYEGFPNKIEENG